MFLLKMHALLGQQVHGPKHWSFRPSAPRKPNSIWGMIIPSQTVAAYIFLKVLCICLLHIQDRATIYQSTELGSLNHLPWQLLGKESSGNDEDWQNLNSGGNQQGFDGRKERRDVPLSIILQTLNSKDWSFTPTSGTSSLCYLHQFSSIQFNKQLTNEWMNSSNPIVHTGYQRYLKHSTFPQKEEGVKNKCMHACSVDSLWSH